MTASRILADLVPMWRGANPGSTSLLLTGLGVLAFGLLDQWSLGTLGPSKAAMLEPDVEPMLDRLIHEPGRLAILTVLSSVQMADFVFLQRATGLTKGNLSSHLTKLEDAGLVEIEKRFLNKKPNTNVALTVVGRERIARHWEQLERLKRRSEDFAQE